MLWIPTIFDLQQICVLRKEDLLVTQLLLTLYVKAGKEALECSFRSFEFVNATYVGKGSKAVGTRMPKIAQMLFNQIVKKCWRVKARLGKILQGIGNCQLY